jgi:hypothetical protein
MRRARWVTVLLVALVAGCAGAGAPTTPTTPSSIGGPDGGVQVQWRAFAAGGGSGIVASRRYPGVLWAIRDRGGRDRPGRPGNAVYAFRVVDGRVGVLAGGVANLSGADLSTDRRRLAVASHTMLHVYAAGDPSPDGGGWWPT